MTNRLRTRLAAATLTAAAAVALACGGAAAAHADGAIPTGYPNLSQVGFLVSDPGTNDHSSASFEATIFADNPSATDVSASVWCNDSRSFSVTTVATRGAITVRGQLPLSEIGNWCYLTATATDGRVVAFSDAQAAYLDDHKFGPLIWGNFLRVVGSGRGHQY